MEKNLKLKMAIFQRGITQEKLAKQTGIPKAYISQVIHGRYIFDHEQQSKISEMLGVRIEEIFPGNKRT